MRIVSNPHDFPREFSCKTGFVPTMGALHEGHLSLIRRSAQENDRTVASIFVNPTQFGPNEDFTKYPRTFEQDCYLAQAAGADIIFAPERDAMYGDNPSHIHVPLVTDLFEGHIRPGHFDGVATIVTKLFNIVSPTNVYFGEKDLQQCALITKLVSDLNFPINIIVCETIREHDGLAMSSRNRYLSPEERTIAPVLHQTLVGAKEQLLRGINTSEVLTNSIEVLTLNSFQVDYFELIDRCIMQPIAVPGSNSSLIVAAKLGTTRLIDNIRVIG